MPPERSDSRHVDMASDEEVIAYRGDAGISAAHLRVRRKSLHREACELEETEQRLFGVTMAEVMPMTGFFRPDFHFRLQVDIVSVQVLDSSLSLKAPQLRIASGPVRLRTEPIDDVSRLAATLFLPYECHKFFSVSLFESHATFPIAVGVVDMSGGVEDVDKFHNEVEVELFDRHLGDVIVLVSIKYAATYGKLDVSDVCVTQSLRRAPKLSRAAIPAGDRATRRRLAAFRWCKLLVTPVCKLDVEDLFPVVHVAGVNQTGIPLAAWGADMTVKLEPGIESFELSLLGERGDGHPYLKTQLRLCDYCDEDVASPLRLSLVDSEGKERGDVTITLEFFEDLARIREQSVVSSRSQMSSSSRSQKPKKHNFRVALRNKFHRHD